MKNDDGVIRIEGVDRPFSRNRILIVLLVPLSMALMSISSVNVALPSIESGIGATSAQIQWILSGYSLAFGIVLVAAGRLGDVLGRGAVFVVGVALFTLSSLVCGLVDDSHALNIARLGQGIGAGIYSPQTNGMIVKYFHGQARATANSLFGLVISVSVAISPLLTGFLIQLMGPDVGWRASFIWNVPLGVIAIIMAFRWLPFDTERKRLRGRKDQVKSVEKLDLDPVGMILMGVSVLLVMLPFMIKTPLGFVLLPIGVLTLVGWLFWERNYKARGHSPMVDLQLFTYPSFTNATVISAVQFLGGTSVFTLLAIYLQQGLNQSAIVSGAIGLPNAVASALAALFAGRYVLRKGRTLQVAALATYATGMTLTIVLTQFMPGITVWWLSLSLVLCGIGVGMLNSANQTLSMLDIPSEAGGAAGGFKQTTERINTAIGNAMLTAVLFSLIPRGWDVAIGVSYGVIVLILLCSMLIAIYDLKTQGNPLDR